VTAARRDIADDDHYGVFSFSIREHAREQPDVSMSRASSNQIRLEECSIDPSPVGREQLWVSPGDVLLALCGELDFAAEVRTGHMGHRHEPS
jgi:hypothetical protein